MPEQVRIKTASDLFEVLTNGSILHQAAVLRSVAEKPERAVDLGSYEGEDFIDLLIRLIPHRDGGVKKLMLMCLSFFQDPRTTRFMLDEFARSRDAASVLHLGRRLVVDQEVDFFRRYLRIDDRPAQSLVAARLLRGEAELSPAERMRVAIFLDEQFEPPELSTEHLDLWLKELSGAHRWKVRQLAEQQSERILTFWSCWDRLAAEEKDWLVALTVQRDSAQAAERLAQVLTRLPVSRFIVAQAISLELQLPASLLESDDEEVRALVIEAGLADSQLERFLAPSASSLEAVAATRRCTGERLVELLADKRWEVRACASQTLSGRCDYSLEKLREKASSEFAGERVAAVEVLLARGDDEWLSEHLAGKEVAYP